ncbi:MULTISPECIES: DUF2214 family protein [unclassified Prochlorococcus]|uniref:DUF2214 family protein n=1 Tax=unclassified Prochlorococcus TaxID=2627481 RepID=UPI0005336E06|nr:MULTISPECIES: DUF2214 family protein [unclassified Prochlorococcus]KGG15014.1 hypothetical protein EV06_1529 [Prochlorococcus sp. MIT 0602]KGG17148.1 hypothetical protein EV07_0581 [Prochlorococcus sp. MIT 0603]
MIDKSILNSALVAYLHYLCIILCFGALLFERLRLKVDLNREEAISIILADIIYGLAGVMLIVTGILRVKFFGQGPEFYTENPLFWFKIASYISVGLLSLYPTITYILWAIPISKNKLPTLTDNLLARFRLIINIEIIGFSLIPLMATLMARGVGLATS